VLLQVGCHNPTGLDYSPAQWQTLIDAMKERDAIALLDFAYQGFHLRPTEDAAPIRFSIEAGLMTLISWSASKNHAIYSEREGLAAAVVPDERTKTQVEDHYCALTRGIHSASARFGQMIVARVQDQYSEQWLSDLNRARAVLKKKRTVLKESLPEDMRPSVSGNGMFALLPLSTEEILRPRSEHLVFLTDDGRINIAGIPLARIDELGDKIRRVRK
jgi:aromatic-amino-acid transaminase